MWELEIKNMKEKTNYGNWVPEKMLYLMFGLAAVFFVITVAAKAVLHKPVIAIVLGALCILSLLYAVYMLICHVVDYLKWNGGGKLLDIGCGAAALTVRCAKAFPEARITAVDYWGVEWSYAKEQCERNARIEGVADQITFWKGDAAKLDFPDGTFDAAVSNFVFHEVRSAKDKRDVVKEALRVVKKGGAFSFQDMFSQKALYGDMDEFVRILKAEGISEVHYIGNLEKKLEFIPGFVTTPWMISGMGILYGKK